MNANTSDPTRVSIVGGGVAAIEAMLALHLIGQSRVAIDVFSRRADFILKPLAVSSAFQRDDLPSFDLGGLTEKAGATFHRRSVTNVNADARRIEFRDGSEMSYDYLIVAIGTKSLQVVPGAKIYWGSSGEETVNEVLKTFRSEKSSRLVLTLPKGNAWSLPIYELALLLKAELEGAGASEASISIVTPEKAPLDLFGEETSRRVSALLGYRGIEVIPETVPAEFRDGALVTTAKEQIGADLVVTLPLLTGQRISGLPYSDEGFIPVDGFGQIHTLDREYAAGDVTDHPVKFGGLATEQADVVAAAIATSAWGESAPAPFEPKLRGTLITADGPVSLGEEPDSGEDKAWDPTRKVQGKYLTPFLEAERN